MTTKKQPIESDLSKVDRHEIAPEEYDDAPEFTEEMLARAEIKDGDGTPNIEGPAKG